MQPGWVAVSPNPQQVIIRDCENARVLFENLEVVGKLQISGTKFFRAWVPPYQGKTVGLSGWGITATLKGTNPAVFVTTVTDALGNYSFSQATLEAAGMAIPGATITVCEEQRDHWIAVSPVCVDVKFPYPVPVDYPGAKVNFTNVQDPPLPGAGISGGSSELGHLRCPLHGEGWRQPLQHRGCQRHHGASADAAQRLGQPQHDPGRPNPVHPVILSS